jgi:hypothetical protein
MLMSERTATSVGLTREPIQRLRARGGKMHHIGSLASFAAEVLAKEISDIRLVVHDQDTHTHNATCAIVVW